MTKKTHLLNFRFKPHRQHLEIPLSVRDDRADIRDDREISGITERTFGDNTKSIEKADDTSPDFPC
ncbi:MAG: hypothetical protein HGA72_04405 [Chlorobiaceae bacterium]|jgi:hypothetical protein|nr:hypothetical protein [Chlorobiaceae bacterium]